MDRTSFPEKSWDNVSQPSGSVNPNTAHTKKHLVKAAGLMGLLTLVSRILGMARDVVNARAFGTGWQWDAFVYAFMIPNFFRRIVGEGALASAFIPVYSETLNKGGSQEAFRFANILMTLLAVVFLFLILVIEFVLYGLLRIESLPQTLAYTLDLLRFFFPYLALVSFYALGMGVLNSHRHFFAPSIAPAVLNLSWILGIFWITAYHGDAGFEIQLRWLSVFILGAGCIQLIIQLPFLYQVGFRPALVWDFFAAPLKKTFRLLTPVVLAFAVVQINLLVDMTLAFIIGPGANSSLWYGGRLMQFPLGIFAIAMGTALLPAISHQVARREIQEARRNMSFALRFIFFIILPCAVGLIVLSQPIVRMLFERGEFDPESTARTSAVLTGYCIGLFAYSGQKIVTSGFYAVQDTRTPVRIAVVSLITNIVLNFILMQHFKEAGLALATSISGILQFLLLLIYFNSKIIRLDRSEIILAVGKIGLATMVMAWAARASYGFLQGRILPETTSGEVLCVMGSIAIALAAYVAGCLLFRVHELKELLEMRKKR